MDDSLHGKSRMRSLAISILANQILEFGSSQSKLVLARHSHGIKNIRVGRSIANKTIIPFAYLLSNKWL